MMPLFLFGFLCLNMDLDGWRYLVARQWSVPATKVVARQRRNKKRETCLKLKFNGPPHPKSAAGTIAQVNSSLQLHISDN